MNNLIKSFNMKKVLGVVISACLLASTISFLSILDIAHGAGLVMGKSTTVSRAGAIDNKCGAPWIDEPIFRVGVSRDKDTYLALNNGWSTMISKFDKKFPANYDSTLYMMSSTLYNNIEKDFGKVTVGWYYTAVKQLRTVGDAEVLDRIKALNPSNPTPVGTNGVYYSVLNTYTLDKLSTLGNGKWKTLLNKKTQAQCLNAWSYILQKKNGSYDIDNRLHEFLQDTDLDANKIDKWTAKEQLDHKLRMLDLLMTCYNIFPDNSQFKPNWENAIEDWVKGTNLSERPVTVLIDTAAAINPGYPTRNDTGVILIGSIDFLGYVGGVEVKYALNTSSYKFVTPGAQPTGTNKTYANITGSVNQSIAASPTFDRIADSLDPNNGFSFSRAILTKYRLTTSGGRVSWKDTDVIASYIDLLQTKDINARHDNISGFMLIASAPLGDTSTNIKVSATPDNAVLAKTQKLIAQPVKIIIDNTTTSAQLAAMKPYIDLATASNPIKVKYTIQRTYKGSTVTLNLPSTLLTYDAKSFTTFIQNGSQTFIDSDVATKEVDPGTTMKFSYSVKMDITLPTKTFSCTGKDDASFIHKKDNGIPDVRTYMSEPSAYSEIKEGRPYNETYEAMAGVPSTEKLYFSAGGSEFIVEITTSLVKDASAIRTYHSYYTSTDCEYKQGDTAGNYTVPTPTGATSSNLTVNAHSGGTVSASWSYTVGNKGVASALTGYNAGTAGSPCAGSGFNAGSPGDITWTDVWDADVYNNAVKNAKTWQSDVNKFIISKTAASDSKNRTWNSWNASLSGNSWGDSISTTQWPSYTKTMGKAGTGSGYVAGFGHGAPDIPAVPSSGTPGEPGYSPGSPAVPNPHQCGSFTAATQTTVTKTGDKSFTITVTATVPPHVVCGPCCLHVLPDVHDTWTQNIAFDHLKIDDVHVWKIDQAAVNGMTEITGSDEVKASIMQGDPNIFYNIAQTETSKDGRIRYTVEPQQHDTVTWDEGTRTNHCNGLGTNGVSSGSGHSSSYADGILYSNTAYPNQKDYEITNSDTKDKSTAEYAKFKGHRETSNTATIISDLLILQTSSGDQSVIYFQKDSQAKQTQENFPKVSATMQEMWDSNSNSAANWTPKYINIGSYNGMYSSPTVKYEGNGGNSRVATKFDNDPARSIVRPTRPSKLLLYKDSVPQIVTNVNKSYITGEAETFWKSILDYPNMSTAIHDNSYQTRYGANGFTLPSPYSSGHAKVNDIIVHDPVSTENAAIMALDKSRDQRSTMPIGSAVDTLDDTNKLNVCPRDPGLCEFRVLNCTYFKDTVLAKFDFEGQLKNSITGDVYELPSGFTIENTNRFGTSKSLSAKGTRWSIPLSDLGITYSPTLQIYVEADINIPVPTGGTGGPMIASFFAYDFWVPGGATTPTWNTGNGWERKSNVDITNKNIKLGLTFDFNNIDRSKMYIDGVEQTSYTRLGESLPITAEIIGDTLNIGSWGADSNYPANFYMDNLKVVRLAGTSTHTDACYSQIKFHPSGLNTHVHTADCVDVNVILNGIGGASSTGDIKIGESKTYNYTGAPQTVTLGPGKYVMETWGAGAEASATYYGITHPASGGYSKGTLTLDREQTLYIYVGGEGKHVNSGIGGAGWNGGGTGMFGDYGVYSIGAGGGGATDIRLSGGVWNDTTGLRSRILVAGGAGGEGTYGGGLQAPQSTGYLNTTSNINYNGNICYGGSQTSGGYRNYYSQYWTGGNGSFGIGGNGFTGNAGGYSTDYGSSGGGGGYYGGVGKFTTHWWYDNDWAAGSRHGRATGGSSFISGYTGCNAINASGTHTGQPNHYSGLVFTDGVMQTGINSGDGKATITNISTQPPNTVNTNIKDVLGDAYRYVFPESLLYTWSWSGTDTKGFTNYNNTAMSVSGNKLLYNITGSDPYCYVPVNIDASAVTSMKIYFDNNTVSTHGQVLWGTVPGGTTPYPWAWPRAAGYEMIANTANQTATIDLGSNSAWAGNITTLRFDFADSPNPTSGNVQISKIELYGYGTVTSGQTEEVNNFAYTGAVQTFAASKGTYKLEVWGAQGGNASYTVASGYTCGNSPLNSGLSYVTVWCHHSHYYPEDYTTYRYSDCTSECHTTTVQRYTTHTHTESCGYVNGYNNTANGGLGGYSVGNINLNAGDTLQVYVGGQGASGSTGTTAGGWNGGGNGYYLSGGGGGGTDIRINGQSLLNRVIVAGGGGGAQVYPDSSHAANGGAGGGLTGENGKTHGAWTTAYTNYGGSQSAGGTAISGWSVNGSAGQGGSYASSYTGGGGGGYYGGAAGAYNGYSGAGGSGYVGTLSSADTLQGQRSGNGYARITKLYSPLTIVSNIGNSTIGSQAFSYTGNAQQFTAPITGQYTFKVWGAQGGSDSVTNGGPGGYSSGTMTLAAGQTVYVYVGGKGATAATGTGGGWNGGGNAGTSGSSGGGGGGTDIRINGTALNNRVIVAGGGGGGGYFGGGAGNGDVNGGGGSGYIGGVSNGTTLKGNESMPSTNGGTQVGQTGDGYAIVSWAGQSIDTTEIRNAIIANYDKIPDTLPDGSPNPIWICRNMLGTGSQVGDMFEKATGNGSGVYDITFPGTSNVLRTIRLDGGYNTPGITTPVMKLKQDTEYILEFDYWSDADGNQFDVDVHPDDLPQILPIANRTVQHYTWKFKSSSANMANAYMRIFNDIKRPNPANIYVTNIRLVESSYYNVHICDTQCYIGEVLNCTEPHHYGLHYDGSNPICWEACGIDANHAFYKTTIKTPTGSTIENGDFINIDWGFRVYFPNIGNFDDGRPYGLAALTSQRGKGFVDNMDTTKWTRNKRVKFGFNAIYEGDGKLYLAGEWIELPVNATYYNFYCVLANYEAKSADVQFEVEAINCPGNNDNAEYMTNRLRYSDFTALHGGTKKSYIDVVGRIGNLVIDDTGDYRFCNFFKMPVTSNDWIVEGVVKKVNDTLQNLYIGFNKDIRGESVSEATGWLNTYGTQAWLNKAPTKLPLSPDKNNILTLRTQPLRPGYDILADISTIGNYRTKMQIVPYYYALNLTTSILTPVDVYMATNGDYEPINIYDAVREGWNSNSVYPYVMNLDWAAEAGRRNYDILEKAHTDYLASIFSEIIKTPDAFGDLVVTGRRELDRPVGNYYALGTAQVLAPSGKARTFIGAEYTNGVNKNPGNRIDASSYWYSAQRWHFKLGLPSSAVFVEHGKTVSPEEINKISNQNYVILMTADIQAVGDTYVLRYSQDGDNGIIKIKNKQYSMPANIPPVLAVYSAEYTARQDVDIRGTH